MICVMRFSSPNKTDAHEPPPRVSVSMLGVVWTLDSQPVPASSGGR